MDIENYCQAGKAEFSKSTCTCLPTAHRQLSLLLYKFAFKPISSMKKIILLVVLALAGVAAWYIWETRKRPKDETPKQAPLTVSRYTEAFNTSIREVLTNYYGLSEAFVQWDSGTVRKSAGALKESLEEVKYDDLKKDTVIWQTAASYHDIMLNDVSTIQASSDITEKRRAFQALTQNLYDLLRVIRYDDAKVYVQECPMAFNDDEAAIWLSRSPDIRNPYLGLHHPKYKGTMLECGENKDSLNFSAQ
jgi:hypothetical protein